MELFKAAREADITDVALALGMEGKRINSRRGTFCCPFHSERTPSLYTYGDGKNPNTFYCFGCKKYGDGANLVRQVMSMGSNSEAARWICEKYNIPYDNGKLPKEPVYHAAPYEAQILSTAVQLWRKYRMQQMLDRHERLREQIDALNVTWDSGEEVMDTFYRLEKAASLASEERDRWENMSVGGVLEEIKSEILNYQPPMVKTKDVPFYGTVS